MPVLAQDFTLTEGGQRHWFVFAGASRVHLLLRPQGRLVAAFPAENSGVAMWFAGHLEAVGQPAAVETKGSGVCVRLRSLQARLAVSDVVLGNIRTIRDRQTGGVKALQREYELRQQVAGGRPAWVRETQTLHGQRLEVRRESWDGGWYRLVADFPPEVKVELHERGWTATGPVPFEFLLTAEVPFASPAGQTAQELFSPETLKLLEKNDPRVKAAVDGLLFLAPKDKFMAGSWRFLTYFGRDTLLSLTLLGPALTPEACARGLESVVKRLSPNGEVAHEEDLGDWAVQERLRRGERKNLNRAVYDYKMIDDDFLLAPALLRLQQRSPATVEAFMRAHGPKVRRNFQFVINRARPYARKPVATNLVALRPDQEVGDWRDSREGLAHGRYPSSVNQDVVLAALRAIAVLAPQQGLDRIIGAWGGSASHFRVYLSPAKVRARLKRYLAHLPLAERRFYRGRPVGPNGPLLAEFLDKGTVPPLLANGLTFPALSLDGRGKPIQVMNTDSAFGLFLGQAPADDFLKLLQLEYPVGLMTGVGPVVANPAYSPNPRLWKELGRKAYHGVVVWSWQSAMIQLGLAKAPPSEAREAVLASLRAADLAAGPLASSELWGVVPGPKTWKATAWTSSHSDESNPVQLWSTVYPALLLELERL